MAKFRKKPVVIDAWLYRQGEEDCDLAYAVGEGRLRYTQDGTVLIKTLEGTMEARSGDYIIRGVNGEDDASDAAVDLLGDRDQRHPLGVLRPDALRGWCDGQSSDGGRGHLRRIARHRRLC